MTAIQTQQRTFQTCTPVQTQRFSPRMEGQCCPPTHEEIARRAYEIYVRTGRKPGQCAQNWLQAEQALRDQSLTNHKAQQPSYGTFSPYWIDDR